jgi:hypothetical protein
LSPGHASAENGQISEAVRHPPPRLDKWAAPRDDEMPERQSHLTNMDDSVYQALTQLPPEFIETTRQSQEHQPRSFENYESSLSPVYAFPENDTVLLLRPLLTTMLRDALAVPEQENENEDSDTSSSSRRLPLPWAALLLDSALPVSQTHQDVATQLLQFAAQTSGQTARQQDDLLQSFRQLLLLSSEPEGNKMESFPQNQASFTQEHKARTTTKKQPLPKKRPAVQRRVVKTRPVPRQTLLSSLSDYDADLGDSEFEELLQDMQLPTYTTEEYEEYEQVSSSEDDDPDDEIYKDGYDQYEEEEPMMVLHQKWAAVDLGYDRSEWQPANLYLPRKGFCERDIRYDSDDLEPDEVLEENDFELLQESNEIEWFDFETLDNILLEQDELDLLSDSDELVSVGEDSEEDGIFAPNEGGLLDTTNAVDQYMDESSIDFHGLDNDESQYDLESGSSIDYGSVPVEDGRDTNEIRTNLLDEPVDSLTQDIENGYNGLGKPDWKIIQSFRKPLHGRFFRFWEWSLFRRLGQTQEDQVDNVAITDNADTVDSIDASPSTTNTLLDDLGEIEDEFDEMNLGDSAVDSFEQNYQPLPPPLPRTQDYAAKRKITGNPYDRDAW